MRILVTGGAGYIGSHAVKHLLEAGHDVVVLDNLDRGHRLAVPDSVPFVQCSLQSTELVQAALAQNQIDTVMHFAALAYVGESVEEPLRYYHNNMGGTISLLRAMDAVGVRRLVFSSTCATYGKPDSLPILETTPQFPMSPYGRSKLFVEKLLHDYASVQDDFAFIALRYFNVAGSARDGTIGEDHHPETHLIPLLLKAAIGTVPQVTIFGDDYNTPDGTCIRDYIHVEDLVEAHIYAMGVLAADGSVVDPEKRRRYFNLGIGRGHSVREVLEAACRVTGRDIPIRIGPRRAGDPPVLYANADKIQTDLGWKPSICEIEAMIDSAWRWFREHPDGYKG